MGPVSGLKGLFCGQILQFTGSVNLANSFYGFRNSVSKVSPMHTFYDTLILFYFTLLLKKNCCQTTFVFWHKFEGLCNVFWFISTTRQAIRVLSWQYSSNVVSCIPVTQGIFQWENITIFLVLPVDFCYSPGINNLGLRPALMVHSFCKWQIGLWECVPIDPLNLPEDGACPPMWWDEKR